MKELKREQLEAGKYYTGSQLQGLIGFGDKIQAENSPQYFTFESEEVNGCFFQSINYKVVSFKDQFGHLHNDKGVDLDALDPSLSYRANSLSGSIQPNGAIFAASEELELMVKDGIWMAYKKHSVDSLGCNLEFIRDIVEIIGVNHKPEDHQQTNAEPEKDESPVGKCVTEANLKLNHCYAILPRSGLCIRKDFAFNAFIFEKNGNKMLRVFEWPNDEDISNILSEDISNIVSGDYTVVSDGMPMAKPADKYNHDAVMKRIAANNDKIADLQKQVAGINVLIKNLQATNQDLTDSLK